jgi:hypothetical protein
MLSPTFFPYTDDFLKMMRLWLAWPVLVIALAVSACGILNKDDKDALSRDPRVCVNGIQYLPYTNGKDVAYTSEGKIETCQQNPAHK